MNPADLIKAVRRRSGLTQAELAERAGTSQPVVSAYEHGRRDPSFATLNKLIGAGGHRLQIRAVADLSDVPQAATLDEHARRLIDVLSLADAIPARPRAARLDAPRMISS